MKLAWALLACMVVCATASDYGSEDESGVADRTSYSYYINGCLLIYVRNGHFKTSEGRKVYYVSLGTSVKFHCNSGYTLDAPYHGECIKSSYSYYRGVMKYNRKARPVCVPDTTVESCKKPSNLPWTIYTRPYRKTTFYVGDSITYYCRSGYELQGTASVSCLKGGIWAAKTPICVREPKCKKPTGLHEAISTAPKDKTIFKVDEKIWYTCRTGYTLKGYADIKCVAANKWQFEPPTCVPNTCEKPTGLHKAIFTAPKDKTTFAVDEKIWYKCQTGYKLKGYADIKCVGPNKWQFEPPTCVPNTCEKPTGLHKAIFTVPKDKTTFAVDEKIWYKCQTGYKLKGYADIKCVGPNKWQFEPPTCVPNSCQKPTGLHEAIFTAPKGKTIFAVDEKIWYKCKTGYTLKGYADIKCIAPNKWKFDPPTCVPNTCEKPTGLHEAIFTVPKDKTTFAVDEKIWYKCQTGYKLKGYADIKCVGPNKWQFEPPTCVPNSCEKPTGLHEAIFTAPKGKTIFAVDEKIWYKCKTGYTLKGYADIKCIAPNKWKFDPPTCVPNTCEKPTGLHEAIFTLPTDKTTFAIDEKIWYKCQTGYKLKGYADIKCVGPNKWQFAPPTCVPNSCQKPTGLHEAIFTAPKGKTFFAVYEKIWYKCKTGYKLKGNADIKCIAPNKWASEPPTCVPNFCRKPTGLHEAIFTAPKGKEVFEIYEKIWYKCKTGYILKGYTDIKCIGPDQWKFDPPTCVPNFCTKPTDLHEAIFTLPKDKETFAIGEKIWYKCQTGYTLKGYADIPCLSPNQWKFDPPTCVPDVVRSCSTPAIPEYGFIKPVQRDYFKGQQVNFFCNPGFEIRGEDQLTCLENGKWSDVEPKCVESQPKKCKPPVINRGVSHRPHQESYDPEIVVWFGCELGYIIKGSKDRTCQNNGTWTGEDSYCVLPIVKARSSSAAYDDCDDVYDYNC